MDHFKVIDQYQAVIKPKGWIVKDVAWYLENGSSEEYAIKKGGFFTDNNISTKRCEEEGVDVFIALRKFQEALKKSKYKIAHNIKFDNGDIGIFRKLVIVEKPENSQIPFSYLRRRRNFLKLKKKHGESWHARDTPS